MQKQPLPQVKLSNRSNCEKQNFSTEQSLETLFSAKLHSGQDVKGTHLFFTRAESLFAKAALQCTFHDNFHEQRMNTTRNTRGHNRYIARSDRHMRCCNCTKKKIFFLNFDIFVVFFLKLYLIGVQIRFLFQRIEPFLKHNLSFFTTHISFRTQVFLSES